MNRIQDTIHRLFHNKFLLKPRWVVMIEHLVQQKDELEKMLITVQTNIIDQLTMLGSNAFDTIYHPKECTCGKESCKCEGK